MRKLPPYIRTVKGKGKRKRCRRCKRKGLRGGKIDDRYLQGAKIILKGLKII